MGEETKAGGKNRNYKKKHEYYDVKGDKAECKNKNCPKCGPAVFLAKHSDRLSCGRCGYTEKTGAPKTDAQVEKPKTEPAPVEDTVKKPEAPKEEKKEEPKESEKSEEKSE
jgi:small subunit ribosomal protein S27Ae